MNTERTPDQIAAELYPITAYKNMWEEAVIKRERAAWLSRQSEVDELKRQVDRAEIRVLEHMVLWENSKNGTLAFEYIAVRDQLNAKENEITELKRQVEELMAFNETCLQNNKSLTAAKEKEMEDWKTIANVYKQRNNKLIEP
jgi:polyhydroxyalkanoate synthesis regulator phasin